MKKDNQEYNTEEVMADIPAEDDIMPEDDIYTEDEDAEAEAENDAANRISLKEYIKEESQEDEQPQTARLSLRKILGGDILYTSAIRRQIWLMMLIIGFFMLYISNRYSCQKDQVEIALLNKTLKNSQYKALAISSELTEHCRESHVLEMLKANNDSTLHTADQPPYIIIVNENE